MSNSDDSSSQSIPFDPSIQSYHNTAFFYGTLMAPAVLKRVTTGKTQPEPASELQEQLRSQPNSESDESNHSSATRRRKAASNDTKSSAKTAQPAMLKGYRRHRVKDCDYPAILPVSSDLDEEASVLGTVITGLTESDWRRLDVFEGDDYGRVNVRVEKVIEDVGIEGVSFDDRRSRAPASIHGHNGQVEKSSAQKWVEAQTYVWIGHVEDLEPNEWDFDEFVREKMWRWAGPGGEAEGEFLELDEYVDNKQDSSGR